MIPALSTAPRRRRSRSEPSQANRASPSSSQGGLARETEHVATTRGGSFWGPTSGGREREGTDGGIHLSAAFVQMRAPGCACVTARVVLASAFSSACVFTRLVAPYSLRTDNPRPLSRPDPRPVVSTLPPWGPPAAPPSAVALLRTRSCFLSDLTLPLFFRSAWWLEKGFALPAGVLCLLARRGTCLLRRDRKSVV